MQPYKRMSLKELDKDNKLSLKYYGPFKVFQRIGSITHRMELTASSQVHLVFHVSYLKKITRDKVPI